MALAAPAWAAPRVAALVPVLKPGGAPEVRDRFHEAAARGLLLAGLDSPSAAEVRTRLTVSQEQLECGGPGPCAARASITLRTDKLLATEVVIAGKDYAVHLKLLDAAGREVAKADATCEICTVKEADDAVTRAATKIATDNRLMMQEPAPPPKPVAAPTPPLLNLEPLPSLAPVVQPAATTVTAATPKDKERKPFPWRWVAVGSLAAGVVGLAVGIPLVVIDGRPTCNLPMPERNCPDVYDTAGGGAALLAVGIGGLAASGVLFYMDYRSRHKAPTPKLSLVPLPEGGAFATVGGRF